MRQTLFWIVGLVLLAGTIEGICLVALWVLERTSGIAYAPSPMTSLTEHHRERVRELLSVENEYGQHDPTLGERGWVSVAAGLRPDAWRWDLACCRIRRLIHPLR